MFNKHHDDQAKIVFDEKKITPENWVRLRFWLPNFTGDNIYPEKLTEKNKIKKTSKNVGHVSLETKNMYLSIWPDSDDETAITLNSKHKIFFMQTPYDDTVAEQRKPDAIIDLFSLNVPLIEEKAEELKQNTTNWQLLGRNKFIGEEGQSCSGLTSELLEIGGIHSHLPKSSQKVIHRFGYTTPSHIFEMAVQLHQYERLKYPKISEFKIEKYKNEPKFEIITKKDL